MMRRRSGGRKSTAPRKTGGVKPMRSSASTRNGRTRSNTGSANTAPFGPKSRTQEQRSQRGGRSRSASPSTRSRRPSAPRSMMRRSSGRMR